MSVAARGGAFADERCIVAGDQYGGVLTSVLVAPFAAVVRKLDLERIAPFHPAVPIAAFRCDAPARAACSPMRGASLPAAKAAACGAKRSSSPLGAVRLRRLRNAMFD
jgi:hypothetical protein